MTDLISADRRRADAEPPPGLVQRIDARVRIVLGAAFALLAVSLSSLPLLGFALATAAGLAMLARLPAGPTLRRMLGLDAFMVPILLFLPFTVPGEPVAVWGAFAISVEGVEQAARIVLTANAVVLALLALVGSIEPAILGHALLGLGVPDKLARMLLLTVRYVAVLRMEYQRLRTAMRARAFRARSDRHTWVSFGYLFGMLLVRSFERSERIADAMKCRGFAGRYFVADAPPLRRADWGFAAALGSVLLVLGAGQVIG